MKAYLASLTPELIENFRSLAKKPVYPHEMFEISSNMTLPSFMEFDKPYELHVNPRLPPTFIDAIGTLLEITSNMPISDSPHEMDFFEDLSLGYKKLADMDDPTKAFLQKEKEIGVWSMSNLKMTVLLKFDGSVNVLIDRTVVRKINAAIATYYDTKYSKMPTGKDIWYNVKDTPFFDLLHWNLNSFVIMPSSFKEELSKENLALRLQARNSDIHLIGRLEMLFQLLEKTPVGTAVAEKDLLIARLQNTLEDMFKSTVARTAIDKNTAFTLINTPYLQVSWSRKDELHIIMKRGHLVDVMNKRLKGLKE